MKSTFIQNFSWFIAPVLAAAGLFYLGYRIAPSVLSFMPDSSTYNKPVSIATLKEALKMRPEKGFKQCLDNDIAGEDIVRVSSLAFCESSYPQLPFDYTALRQSELSLLKPR